MNESMRGCQEEERSRRQTAATAGISPGKPAQHSSNARGGEGGGLLPGERACKRMAKKINSPKRNEKKKNQVFRKAK